VNVAIDAVSGNPANNGETPSATTTRDEALGRDAFLRLLLVQLQNQDPTSPQSNTEFIAQLAQFSALEQLTSINQAVSEMSRFFSDVTDGLQQLADDRSATEGN
jgi:flagellar basal-body rod modification protein FlgD